MKLFILNVMILATILASVSCSPGPQGPANDDIVSPPGGITYRANVHQQGERDWPPVKQTKVTLQVLGGTIDIEYRDYIETRAGQTRNNIIFLSGRNAPDLLDPLKITYRPEGRPPVNHPEGITIARDGEMYGGIGGRDKKSSRVILVIHIDSRIKRGEYPFEIQLEYEGKIFGSLPVTVKVK